MDNNRQFQFSLHISTEDYIAYYEGIARYVLVITFEGLKLKFPASFLRQFLTHDGIHGLFEIEIDHNNKLVDIHRIEQTGSNIN